MATLPPELEALPEPTIIEEIDFEVRLSVLRTRLQQIFDEVGFDYDVGNLETDPSQILLQVSAYQDVLLRQRINEAIRSTLLAYANGTDLDILAQWYDVSRLPGEDDARLRGRIVLAIRGRSTGGTEARYKSIAMAADVRVADVAVYTVGRDPTIRVAVFSIEPGGVASAALLAKVDTALQSPNVRMVNDVIVVASAAQQVVNVEANMWLLPQASDGAIALAESKLRTAWAREMLLGRDVTRSWVLAQLQVDGVQRVDLVSPSVDIVLPFNEAAGLGTVTLTKAGRAY